MDLTMDPEQQEIVETVRRFVREQIVPLEHNLDPDASELAPADFDRLADMTRSMGLWNLDVPEEFGGPGLDTMTRTLIAMETSQHRAGLYNACYGVFGPGSLAHLYEADAYQRAQYLEPTLRGEKTAFFALTEPSGGSDPARSIITKAVPDGDDWLLSGSKVFISGAADADYGLVFARTGGADSGRKGITCFIVDTDTPGFAVRRVIHTLRSGHYPTELEFADARVSGRNVLGAVGEGFSLANDRLSRNRIPYAAACIGVAMAAHELAVEYSKIRTVFSQQLSEHEGIQWMLVDNEIDIRTGSLVTLQAADLADKGKNFRSAAAVAKIVATEAASRVVDRCIQIHGGYGVTTDLPLERWYREMRIRRIGEGTTETQRMIVSRDLLRDTSRKGGAPKLFGG